MESTLHKIHSLYPRMGYAEKKIADYLVNDLQNLLDLSVNDIATNSGCGAATVIRFARRLGFKGYHSMKLRILQEISDSTPLIGGITPEDDCFTIFQKRRYEIDAVLHATEQVLDTQSMNAAAEKILHAKRIELFGLGNSSVVAIDAASKLLRLGYDAHACSDSHLQAITASHLDRQCVAIAISNSGTTRDIVDALQLSKIGSATTICVTGNPDSPLVKFADISLFTKSEDVKSSLLALTTRTAQFAIMDAIYNYVALRKSNAASQAIYNAEYALDKKRLSKKQVTPDLTTKS